MTVVSREIEAEGLFGVKDMPELEEPMWVHLLPFKTPHSNLGDSKRGADVLSFARFACMDGLSLMP